MMKPLDIILSFINVKKWSREELYHLQTKHIFYGRSTWIGNPMTCEELCELLHPTSSSIHFTQCSNDNASVFELPDEVIFEALSILQRRWRITLNMIIKKGHDLNHLDQIAKKAVWKIEALTNPFSPRFAPTGYGQGVKEIGPTLGEVLDLRYLDAALTQGDDFRKLRICKNPGCEKMFIFKRGSKKSCSDKCRLAFHNKTYNQSGQNAARMKKLRAEGKCQ